MSSEETADARQGIQSVENAMTVLLALEHGGGPMTLTQIAEGAGMQPSKAHRYLVSLGRVGLVSQSPRSGRYDLGPSMRRLGAEALRRMDEVGLASEYLPGLRDRTGHAVGLFVWGEHGPVLVRAEHGSDVLPMIVRVGTTLPLVTTSAGQVFLAYLPATQTEPILRSNRTRNGQAIDDAEELARIKEKVRSDGLVVTTNAVLPNVSAIAAPVLGADGSLLLVVVITLPGPDLTPAYARGIGDELLSTTGAISAELGYVPRVPS
ncbi:MAG TPA: IclR family transcriptional regulator [Pseudonocardia sp.]|nr:IclR family transcriptional regulator [Pseudonocardia sp.]